MYDMGCSRNIVTTSHTTNSAFDEIADDDTIALCGKRRRPKERNIARRS